VTPQRHTRKSQTLEALAQLHASIIAKATAREALFVENQQPATPPLAAKLRRNARQTQVAAPKSQELVAPFKKIEVNWPLEPPSSILLPS
jgi:hypothetical protein